MLFQRIRKVEQVVKGFVVNPTTGEIGRVMDEGRGYDVEYPATIKTADGTVQAYMVRGDYWPHARPATLADASLYDADLWAAALSATVQH